MFMTNKQPAKLSQPSIGPLHDPAALVPPQLAPVFVPPMVVVLAIRDDQFDSATAQSLAQRIGIVTAIGNHPLRFLSRAALGSRDPDFGKRGFRKLNFTGGGTFQPNSQRKTFTVDQYHPLRALAPLGFPDGRAPFFPGAKLPSRKVSSHLNNPSSSSPPSSARQPSPAGRGRGELVGQKAPRRTRLQHPQNALETSPVRGCRPPPFVSSASRLRKQRLNQLPLLVCQQLLPLLHGRSSTAYPPHAQLLSARPNLFLKHALRTRPALGSA